MCMQCLQELGRPSFEPFMVDYFDDGVGQFECTAGHKSALLIQSLKFELLMESGATALLQGYTLEACASFSTALERFYEFALKVMCEKNSLAAELYDKMFNEMSRQSERQLGAFMLLYALSFGEAYKLDQKITEFRNAVIHKGTIPSPDRAAEFCARVYAVIETLYAKLSVHHDSQIHLVVTRELQDKRSKLPAAMPVATSSGTTFFNHVVAQRPAYFEAALDCFRQSRERIANALPELHRLHTNELASVSAERQASK
jgi:hypothetical protein